MSTETDLQLISTIVILVAIIIPVYISIKLRNSSNSMLRKLIITLAIFILIHGIYHITDLLGFSFLAESLFEPLSIAILISFGLLYFRISQTKQEIKT